MVGCYAGGLDALCVEHWMTECSIVGELKERGFLIKFLSLLTFSVFDFLGNLRGYGTP